MTAGTFSRRHRRSLRRRLRHILPFPAAAPAPAPPPYGTVAGRFVQRRGTMNRILAVSWLAFSTVLRRP